MTGWKLWRWLLGFLVAIPLMGVHAPENASANLQRGAVLTSVDGVTVHWNGSDPSYWERGGDGSAYQQAPRGDYGYKYQCVELIQRYFAHRWGHPRYWAGVTYAYQMMENHPAGTTAIWNGSSPGPRRGDALVFSNGGAGHVALVTDVRDGRVYFVEQNWPGSSNGQGSLPIDGSNRVAARGTYSVRGWIHSDSNTGQPANTSATGPFVFKDVQVYSSSTLDVTAGDRVGAVVVATYVGGRGPLECGRINLGRIGDAPASFRDDAAGPWPASTWRSPNRVAAVGCNGLLHEGQRAQWNLTFNVPAGTAPQVYETGPWAPVYDGPNGAWSNLSIPVNLRVTSRTGTGGGQLMFKDVQVYSSSTVDVTAGDRVGVVVVATYVGGRGPLECGRINLGRIGDAAAPFRDDAAGPWPASAWRSPNRVAAVGCNGLLHEGQRAQWSLTFNVPPETMPQMYTTGSWAPVYDGPNGAWSNLSIPVNLRVTPRP